MADSTPPAPGAKHLVIDAVGTRPESGGVVVLGDILRAAAQHPGVAQTSVFVAPDVQLRLPLRADRQRVIPTIAAGRARLLWWNTRGLEQHAVRCGADAILSLNGMGRARRLPMFVLFQQQLMFAPDAVARMPRAFRFRLALMRRLSILACRKARLTFVQAEHVRASLLEHFAVEPSRLCLIRPDVYWSGPASEPVPREPGLVAYVGSARPHKSLDTLLAAFRLVRRRIPEARLELSLGPGLLAAEPSVLALGRLDRAEVRRLLARARVLVMPSLAETVGLPLLEALDLGCAVVASDLPYAREVCGDAARYFAPRDAEACADHIIGLLTDEARCDETAAHGQRLITSRREQQPYRRLLNELLALVP